MQNELIEYNKRISGEQVFFLLKCINDCCHLEVAHTVKSLQPFLVFNNNKMHTVWNRATVICNSLRINAETAQVSSVMVLRHNAYFAKQKCIPVGLYRLLCLKAEGVVNCRVAHVSEPKRLPIVVVWHLMSERGLQMVSLCKMFVPHLGL